MSSKGYKVNVAQMEREQEMKQARAFRNSMRGKFILSQRACPTIKQRKYGVLKETTISTV